MPDSRISLAARGVTAYGLPGGAPLPDTPLTPPEWEAMIRKVRRHRIAGFLMRAVQEGSFAVDQQQRRQAATIFKESRVYTISLQSRLLYVAGLLEQAGVDYRVLKGASLAALAYPDQALRSYGDIDILVRPAQFEHTVELLEREGYQPALGWHRVGHGHDKGTTLIADDGSSGDLHYIDLHYALARGPYRWLVPSADLFTEPQTFPLGTRRLPAMASPQQFLHVCLHARVGNTPPRLLSIRDVAQCALHTDINWTVVQQLCAKWQISGVVSEAIHAVQDGLRIPLGDPVRSLANYHPSIREQRFIRAYESVNLPIATLAVIPGAARKVGYTYNLVFPGKQYMLGCGYKNHRTRWRRVVRLTAALFVSRLRRCSGLPRVPWRL
jgi:hypothetical protein